MIANWIIFSKNLNIKIYSLHQQQNKHSNKIKKNDMYTYGHTDCWPIPILSIQRSLHPTLFLLLLKRELPYKFFKHSHVEEATDINCYWNGEKISWSVSSTITSLGLFFWRLGVIFVSNAFNDNVSIRVLCIYESLRSRIIASMKSC